MKQQDVKRVTDRINVTASRNENFKIKVDKSIVDLKLSNDLEIRPNTLLYIFVAYDNLLII